MNLHIVHFVSVYGKKHQLYHCIKCNKSIKIKNKLTHLCNEVDHNKLKNQAKEDCLICLEEILIESDQYLKLLCNHHLHKACYEQLIKNTDVNKKYLGVLYVKIYSFNKRL